MSEENPVAYEVTGAVARIRLDRPDYRNAQNSAMTYALDAAFQRAVDDAVKVMVLSGNGKTSAQVMTSAPLGRDVDKSFERKAVIWWDHVDKEAADWRFARESEVYLGMAPLLARDPQARDRHGAPCLHSRRIDVGVELRLHRGQ